MFGVGGERELPERELPLLPGWRDSTPVRVGNGAGTSAISTFSGELLDAVATLPEYLAGSHADTRMFLADAADAAAAAGARRNTASGRSAASPGTVCYSKLMCWVAVDRAVALAGILRRHERVPHCCARLWSRSWPPSCEHWSAGHATPGLQPMTSTLRH